MPDASDRINRRTIDTIALAYFAHSNHLHDAVRDLCSAGFAADHINISGTLGQEMGGDGPEAGASLPNAIGAHSLRWSFDRMRKHDRNRSGADQMSGLNPTPSEGLNPTCSVLDLASVLKALAVPQDVVWLLEQDVRKQGSFVLVDAPQRVEEASVILSGNAGYLRN